MNDLWNIHLSQRITELIRFGALKFHRTLADNFAVVCRPDFDACRSLKIRLNSFP